MWESLKEIIERISERPGPLLMVCGVLLFTFGIAEGIKYESWLPLTDPIGRYSAIAGGIVVFLVGVYFAKRSPAPLLKAEAYGIKIRTPERKEHIEIANVTGDFKKLPPEGYTLMVLRIYPDVKRGFIFLNNEVDFDLANKTWSAGKCELGGKVDDRRIVGAYLVGKSGRALKQFFDDATQLHNATKKELEESTGKPSSFLPVIPKMTTDMIKCDEVLVYRK